MNFKDGSWARLKITDIDTDKNLTLKFLEGRDKDNNSIKDEASHYKNGSFRFIKGGALSFNNFLAAAARAGVPIQYGNGSGGGLKTQKLTCTGSAAGGDLICTVTKNTK